MVEQRAIDLSAIKDPAAVEIIKFLLERIRLLEEEVARLKKNSTTSSKPPSSDITKPPEKQRRPGERKIGGQMQHEGKSREMLPAEKVETKELKVEQCPDCGDKLKETPEAKVLIVNHQPAPHLENPKKAVIIVRREHYGKYGNQEASKHL